MCQEALLSFLICRGDQRSRKRLRQHNKSRSMQRLCTDYAVLRAMHKLFSTVHNRLCVSLKIQEVHAALHDFIVEECSSQSGVWVLVCRVHSEAGQSSHS